MDEHRLVVWSDICKLFCAANAGDDQIITNQLFIWQYRPICMMVALIWWSLIGTCGLYYQARLIEFEIQQNRYEDLLWSVAHVLIVCGLFVCAACSYKSVQRSTAHLRRMAANPLSAVAYEVIFVFCSIWINTCHCGFHVCCGLGFVFFFAHILFLK